MCSSDLFVLAHDVLGHFGFDKTYGSLRNAYYWPNMRRDLEQGYVPSCPDCQRNKSPTNKPYVWQQGPASFNITAKTDICTLPINMPKLINYSIMYPHFAGGSLRHPNCVAAVHHSFTEINLHCSYILHNIRSIYAHIR